MKRPRPAPLLCVLLAVAGCGGLPSGSRVLLTGARGFTCVTRAGDALWLGHESAGLITLPAAGGAARTFAADAGLVAGLGQVRWVAPGAGGLWLATNGGVALFSARTGRVARAWTTRDGLGADSVRWVGETRQGVWAGSIGGASRLEPARTRWRTWTKAEGLPENHVFRMLETADGTLWASSMMGGLIRFDRAAGRWDAIPRDRGRGNRWIYALCGGERALWLGTAGGVNRYDLAAGAWDPAVCDDGYTAYTVRAVQLAGDDLWFGTSYGVFRRNLKTGRQARWTAADGLPSDEVGALVPDGDRLLVLCTTGLLAVPLK